jgi:hypothetical protein
VTILFDENLSPRHASRLRNLGIDAIAVPDIGLSGASDAEVRAFSIATGRVLITMDADFGNILRYPVVETPECDLVATPSSNGGRDHRSAGSGFGKARHSEFDRQASGS